MAIEPLTRSAVRATIDLTLLAVVAINLRFILRRLLVVYLDEAGERVEAVDVLELLLRRVRALTSGFI